MGSSSIYDLANIIGYQLGRKQKHFFHLFCFFFSIYGKMRLGAGVVYELPSEVWDKKVRTSWLS